jgi:hypothetical protein
VLKLNLCLITVALVPLPAFAVEYQAGTQPRTVTTLQAGDSQLPVGLQTERAQYCVECHDFGLAGPTSTSPGAMWKGTMMANAARDPLMFAALAIANQDVPGIGGDYCLRCHSPAGFLDGHTTPNPASPNQWPCNNYQLNSLNQCIDYCQETPARVANGYCLIQFGDNADATFQGHPFDPKSHPDEPNEQQVTPDGGVAHDPYDDAEGVSCAVCHRMQNNQTDPTPFQNQFGGNYSLRYDAQQQPGWLEQRTVRAGPYATIYANCSDQNNPATCNPPGSPHPHPAAQSDFHTRSDFCGQCHDVTNPLLNRLSQTGVDQGFKMPIERTFSEWRASSVGRTGDPAFKLCQDCHMPAMNNGPVCIASQLSLNRTAVPQHEFTGGNWWLPTVFANVMQPSAGAGDPAWFYNLITGVDRQGAYLAVAQAATATLGRAALLTVSGQPVSTQSGGTIPFNVRITNQTGHKLPTGYPEGRRMWLQVIASVPSQMGVPAANPFFQSGAYDDTTGVLTKDSQIKVYEVELSVAGKTAAPSPPEFHFVTNQIVWKDNRIPPLGFDPTAANYNEMTPVGITYPLDGNGRLVNYDDTSYSVPVPAFATGDIQVMVRLVYQTTSKEYIDFLRQTNTSNNRGSDMTTIWQNHGRGPFVVMVSQTFNVTNSMPCVPSPEVCDGKDNDCDGVVDNGVCGDMGVPTDDAGPDMGGHSAPHGCGVSVAGNDWRDLGPLALLMALAIFYGTVRARARARSRSGA